MSAKKRVASKSSKRLTAPGAASTLNATGSTTGEHWTKTEHARFLQALEIYPRGPWKKIAEHIGGTRTVRQVMTHAQKYQEKVVRWNRGLQNEQAISRMAKGHAVSADSLAQERAKVDRKKTATCLAEPQQQKDRQAQWDHMTTDRTNLLATPPLGPCLPPTQIPSWDPDKTRPHAIATATMNRALDPERMESLSLTSKKECKGPCIDQDLADTDMITVDELPDGLNNARLDSLSWWGDDCADESPPTTCAAPPESFEDSDVELLTCAPSPAEMAHILGDLEGYLATTW